MKTSNVIVWLNSVASDSTRAFARKVMPIGLKRSIGKRIMRDVYRGQGVTEANDGRVFKNIEDRLFLRVCLDRTYEPLLTEVAKRLIRKGDNVVDVGANFGWYSTLFGVLTGQRGRVFSYEPLQRSYDILTENISLNKLSTVVTPINKAVGKESGTVFLGGGDSSESGLAHVVAGSKQGVETQCVCLAEEHVNIAGELSYLKVDIEGYEQLALEGASVLLQCENQPIIQLELNQEALNRAESSREKLLEILTNIGYEFFEAVPGSQGKIRKANLSQCSDVFCIGSGRFADRAQEIIVN